MRKTFNIWKFRLQVSWSKSLVWFIRSRSGICHVSLLSLGWAEHPDGMKALEITIGPIHILAGYDG